MTLLQGSPYANKMPAPGWGRAEKTLLESPVQEGDHLCPVAGAVGTELGGGDAVGVLKPLL